MFRKKDSNATLYLYHFHQRLYNMVTKEILLAIAKERNLQKRTILPFGTLSPHYHTLKDQTFLKELEGLLKSRKRIMRSKSPSPVFIPGPGPSGGTGEPTIIAIPEPPPSAPVTAPPPHVGPIPVIRQYIHPSSSLLKEVLPLPPIALRIPSPPLVDPSPFVQIPTYPSPPIMESPQVASPPLPLVPWGSHRQQYLSMEQYKPPAPINETPNPVNVLLLSRAVLVPPSLSYKPVTPRPHDRGNISHDPTCDSSRDRGNISHDPTRDSSRDPFATYTSRDLSARDPGNLRPRDPGKITHDLSRNWSSTMSHDKMCFGCVSNPLINTWQIMGTINKTRPLNNQRTRDSLGLDPNRDVLCNPQLLRIDCAVPHYL